MISEENSIHLQAFPEYQEKFHDQKLETAMDLARKIVELGHSLRREKQLKARQPLASLKVSGFAELEYRDELEALLLMELNVKKIEWLDNSGDLRVDYDFNLTDELRAEGEAREIIRQIQDLRKEALLDMNKIVEVELPNYPEAFKQEIEEKTNTKIVAGEIAKLKI
jgi:isoleucyl-tRNA synthetase